MSNSGPDKCAARDKSKILLGKSTLLVGCPAGQVQKFPLIFIFQVLTDLLWLIIKEIKGGILSTTSGDNHTIIGVGNPHHLAEWSTNQWLTHGLSQQESSVMQIVQCKHPSWNTGFDWLDILAIDQICSKPDLEKCFRLKNGLILDHSGVAHLPARQSLLPSTVKHQVKKPVWQ